MGSRKLLLQFTEHNDGVQCCDLSPDTSLVVSADIGAEVIVSVHVHVPMYMYMTHMHMTTYIHTYIHMIHTYVHVHTIVLHNVTLMSV